MVICRLLGSRVGWVQVFFKYDILSIFFLSWLKAVESGVRCLRATEAVAVYQCSWGTLLPVLRGFGVASRIVLYLQHRYETCADR